jgi:hypothetical protein
LITKYKLPPLIPHGNREMYATFGVDEGAFECRVENYKVFLGDEFKKHLKKEDIKLVGYRAIRDAMRS